MGRSVRIPPRVGRMIESVLIDANKQAFAHQYAAEALREFRALMNPPRIRKIKPRQNSAFDHAVNARLSRSRKPSKEEKKDDTSAIRAACYERAAGICECGCGHPVHHDAAALQIDWNAQAELDHFFGRGKVKQSVETCWILRADCHREKTNSRPDAATWLRKFLTHVARRRSIAAGSDAYPRWCDVEDAVKARLRFVETRAALPAAPRVRHD